MQYIMIIEDDPAIREELKSLLEGVPYRVTAPEPDTDLIELVRKEQPDLLLLDIGLPGTDGLTICSRLRKESRIPVIFVTARNTSMDELNCLLRGGDDFVAKPYQPGGPAGPHRRRPAQNRPGTGRSSYLEKCKAGSGLRDRLPERGRRPQHGAVQK